MEIQKKLLEKLYDQPFTVILLVALLVWQNKAQDKQNNRLFQKAEASHIEYEEMVTADRDLLIERNKELVEAIKISNQKHDQTKTELYQLMITKIEELNQDIIECEKK